MTHTHGNSGRRFIETIEMEKEVVYMVAELLGAEPEKTDGYISTGGTEANIMGLWIGRNKLQNQSHSKKIAVISSFLCHYSIHKGCNLLGISESSNKDGSGFHLLGTDNKGKILLSQIHKTIEGCLKNGVNNFIIVGTAGTTLLGSVDSITEINELIKSTEKHHPSANFFFHVDACFGGFVIPFLEDAQKIGFDCDKVDSIAIDPHKIGMTPFPAGIFLCRKNLQKYIERKVGYLHGGCDDTLCGSRPGAVAAACWAIFKHLGYEGYAEIISKCMETTIFLRNQIESVGFNLFDNEINILAVKSPPFIPNDILEKYVIVPDGIPSNLADINSEIVKIYKFVLMPHVTKQQISLFISELNQKKRR
ncbi:MAG: pyridoxal-dependent decarboxylase [bacterium]